MSIRDKAAAKAAQRDVDYVSKVIYRRSLQGEDTSVADLMPLVFIRARYGGGYTTTSKQGMEDAARASKAYTRSLMRQAAAQHPNIARRLKFT